MKLISIFLSGFLFVSISSCQVNEMKEAEENTKHISRKELITRGQYLVAVMACHECHTPKKMSNNGPVLNSDSLLCGHLGGMDLPEVNWNLVQKGEWTLANSSNSAFAGPWGISFAANLTPDKETGLGSWTFEEFNRVIREGKHVQGDSSRNILPPMPWRRYRKLYDNDAVAIYTYLKSLKPIRNEVPKPIPPR